jgi:hypothetical protein
MPPVPKLLATWTATGNRRRALEELAAAAAWLALLAIVAVGLHRLPIALAWIDVEAPRWLGTDDARATWLLTGWCVLAAVVIASAGRRFLRRRTRAFGLARELDRKHGTADLLATAWSIETGAIAADPGLASVVVERARATASTIQRPVAPWAAPTRALASLGILAAVVGLVPFAPPVGDLAGTANAAEGPVAPRSTRRRCTSSSAPPKASRSSSAGPRCATRRSARSRRRARTSRRCARIRARASRRCRRPSRRCATRRVRPSAKGCSIRRR